MASRCRRLHPVRGGAVVVTIIISFSMQQQHSVDAASDFERLLEQPWLEHTPLILPFKEQCAPVVLSSSTESVHGRQPQEPHSVALVSVSSSEASADMIFKQENSLELPLETTFYDSTVDDNPQELLLQPASFLDVSVSLMARNGENKTVRCHRHSRMQQRHMGMGRPVVNPKTAWIKATIANTKTVEQDEPQEANTLKVPETAETAATAAEPAVTKDADSNEDLVQDKTFSKLGFLLKALAWILSIVLALPCLVFLILWYIRRSDEANHGRKMEQLLRELQTRSGESELAASVMDPIHGTVDPRNDDDVGEARADNQIVVVETGDLPAGEPPLDETNNQETTQKECALETAQGVDKSADTVSDSESGHGSMAEQLTMEPEPLDGAKPGGSISGDLALNETRIAMPMSHILSDAEPVSLVDFLTPSSETMDLPSRDVEENSEMVQDCSAEGSKRRRRRRGGRKKRVGNSEPNEDDMRAMFKWIDPMPDQPSSTETTFGRTYETMIPALVVDTHTWLIPDEQPRGGAAKSESADQNDDDDCETLDMLLTSTMSSNKRRRRRRRKHGGVDQPAGHALRIVIGPNQETTTDPLHLLSEVETESHGPAVDSCHIARSV